MNAMPNQSAPDSIVIPAGASRSAGIQHIECRWPLDPGLRRDNGSRLNHGFPDQFGLRQFTGNAP